jgi:hypothetical protein
MSVLSPASWPAAIAAEEPSALAFENLDLRLFQGFEKKEPLCESRPFATIFLILEFPTSRDVQTFQKKLRPSKSQAKIIFRLRKENFHAKAGPSLKHQPAVVLCVAVLDQNDGQNDHLVFNWLKNSRTHPFKLAGRAAQAKRLPGS